MTLLDLIKWILGFFHRPLRITNLKANLHMAIANLTWTLPTTRVDGSPLPLGQISSVTIFDGSAQIGQTGAVTSFATGSLDNGVHSFTVTVTDSDGNTSAKSNAAVVNVVEAVPSAVTDLAVTLA